MSILRKPFALFVLSLFLLSAAASAHAAVAKVRVHEFGFLYREHGVIEPARWWADQRSPLTSATEEELSATLLEGPEIRDSRMSGKIVLRAYDAAGSVIYRTIVTIPIRYDLEGVQQPAIDPLFFVEVPEATVIVEFDGWEPATHVRFDVGQLSAQVGHLSPNAADEPQRFATAKGLINVLIVGDGYTNSNEDKSAFATDAANAKKQLFANAPFDYYKSFFNVMIADAQSGWYVSSHHSGANHPMCTDPKAEIDTKEGGTPEHDTAFKSTYCSGNVQRTLVVDNNLVTEAVKRMITEDDPEVVMVIVNDTLWGATGGLYAVISKGTVDRSVSVVDHEIAHQFASLKDEYDDLTISPLPCSDHGANGITITCGRNITDGVPPPITKEKIKWSRWITKDPVPVCAAGAPCLDRTAVGLYEGAGRAHTGLWRSEYTCLLRDDHSSFCHLCQDFLIRRFYETANLIGDIRECARSAECRAEKQLSAPEPVQPGTPVSLGATVRAWPDIVGPPNPNILSWSVNGVKQDESLPSFTFTPTEGGTTHIELEATDNTVRVRADTAFPKPPGMTRKVAWDIVAAARAQAASDGVLPVSAETQLLARQGTATATLTYRVTTNEPGGRAGDAWSVTVGYAGSSSPAPLSVTEPLFHAEGTIASVAGNLSNTVTLKVDAASADRRLVVEVKIQNLETESFLSSFVEASLSADPLACVDCASCVTNPNGPGCPTNFSVVRAELLPVDEPERNHGDSSYYSLGEKLNSGRHVILDLKTPPDISQLDALVEAYTLDGGYIGTVRNARWYRYGGPDASRNFDSNDAHTRWDLRINMKKEVEYDKPDFAIPESAWEHDIKFRLTLKAYQPGRPATTIVHAIDKIMAGDTGSQHDYTPHSLHALWHTPYSQSKSYFWSSLPMHRWLKDHASWFHFPADIADEHAAYNTPFGHQFGSGVREVPYFPGATASQHTYLTFRASARDAISSTDPTKKRNGRAVLAAWVANTRVHLDTLLPRDEVTQIRLGDGIYDPRANDHLPAHWMSNLLLQGQILGDDGSVLLDMSGETGGPWATPWVNKLYFTTSEEEWHNIIFDRCRIGEVGTCMPAGGGRTILKHTHIVTQPQPVTVAPGQTAHLSVAAEGDALRYQWYVGGVASPNPLRGKNSAELDVTPASTSSYWVAVSGAVGIQFSVPALVTVTGTGSTPCITAPAITQQPALDSTLLSGQAGLSVTASGNGLHYQWSRLDDDTGIDTPILFAVAASHTATEAGTYRVRVWNDCGFVDSRQALVRSEPVCAGAAILNITDDQLINAGQAVSLSVTAAGKDPITYSWTQKLPGGSTSVVGTTAQLTVIPPADGTQYIVTLTNPCGSLVSAPVTVSIAPPVCAPLVIALPPADDAQVLPAGGSAVARAVVGVSGAAPFTYEWHESSATGPLLSGPTTSSLPSNQYSLTFTAAGSKTVVAKVTDACGHSIATNPVTLSATSCAFRITYFGPSGAITATPAQPVQLFVETDPADDPAHPRYTYAWTKDGAPIAGSGVSLYVTTASFASFRVRVTNIACQSALTSAPAYVKLYGVCPLPPVSVSPTSQTVTGGGSGLVQAFVAWPDVTFQWYRGESGDTHQPLTGVPQHGDQLAVNDSPSRYWVRVTNPCGQSEDSAAVSVSRSDTTGVCDSVAITTISPDTSIASGAPVTLSVRAASASYVSYQWFANGTPIAGATAADTVVQPLETTRYFVRATNVCGGSLDSRTITVHVTSCGASSFTTQPADQTTDDRTPVTLTAAAGSSAMQWYEGMSGDSSHPVAATSGTFTTPLLAASTSYWVRATTSSGCRFDSRTALVDVCVKPAVTLGDAGYRNTVPGEYVWIGFHYTGSNLQYQWFLGASGDTSQPLGNGTDLIQVHPFQTTKWWVRVSNRCGSADSPTYTVSICPGIVELTASAAVVMPNGTVQLHARGSGTFLTYQWYRGAQNDRSQPLAAGADVTSPTITAPARFWCLISSGTCGVPSSEVTVDVCPPNQISFVGEGVGGARTHVRRNEPQFLKVVAPTGVQMSYYQGQSGEVAHSTLLEGRTNNYSISIAPPQTTDYWVREFDPNGICSSDTPTLTIYVCVPQITAQPADTMIASGATAHFSVTADITPVTYQWYRGASPATGTLIAGATAATLDVPNLTADASYCVRVTGSCSAYVDSRAAAVTICQPARITAQPQPVTSAPPNGANLTVTAAGSPASGTALTYQWYQGTAGVTTTAVGTSSATLHVNPSATTSYWVRVSGAACGTAADSSAAVVSVCPTISQQPAANPSSLVSGQSTNITVIAGGGSLHYQWYRGTVGDRTQAVGTDAPSLSTGPLTANTTYWVEVRSGNCAVQSNAVTVSVCTPPTVTFNPLTTQVRSGQGQTLTVTPIPGATYNFYIGAAGDLAHSTAIGTTTANTWNIAPTVTTSYWASATTGCTGNTATVTINVCIPQVTTQPASTQINSGQSARLNAGTNITPVTWQWYAGAAGVTSNPISGATSSTLDVFPTSTTSYWVRVTGNCGSSADSAAAVVTVCALPQITTQPYDAPPVFSGSATGTGVQATGTGLTYQWYLGESGVTTTPVSSATAATITIAHATASARYWVRISNSCGSVNSNAAWVSVNPVVQGQPADTSVPYGTTATLSFNVSGTALHYRWYQGFDRTRPVGTDSPTFVTPPITGAMNYFCDATSGTAGTMSNIVTVTCDGCP